MKNARNINDTMYNTKKRRDFEVMDENYRIILELKSEINIS